MEFADSYQECSVDQKRRVSLPPKQRARFTTQRLPSGVVQLVHLIPWFGGALAAFPVPSWEVIRNRLALLDFTIPDLLPAKRQCFPRMESLNTDPEGRLTLPSDHLAWLRLSPKGNGKVVVAGMGPYLEIWNAAEYPEVKRNGQNGATRDAADIQYDKQLEILMRAAKAEELARPASAGLPAGLPAGEAEAEDEETG